MVSFIDYNCMIAARKKAFSLVELLVVISVIAVLMAILIPALSAARSQARSMVCKSNLRQLLLANIGYATENDGFYVPAASDMWDNSGRHRWHGVRNNLNEPFDPLKGPLVSYLANGLVKECPARVKFIKGQNWNTNFEQGCGGYGYNMAYLGSRLWQSGIATMAQYKAAYARTTAMTEVRNCVETLMFADTAMSNEAPNLIEYSFAEPPFYVYEGYPVTSFYMSPSIHFRHGKRANIGWVDGHVDQRAMTKFDGENVFFVESGKMMLGWFEPIDNTPFDLR